MADTLRSRFFSGTVFTSFGRMFTVILGFAGLLVSSRLLSQSDLGNFLLLQTIVGLFVGVSDFGITTAVTQLLAKEEDEEKKQKIVNSTIIFRFILFVLFCLLFLVVKDIFFRLYGKTINTELIIFIPILFFIQNAEALFAALLQGLFRFKFLGAADIIASVTSFLMIILLVWVFNFGVIGRIYARIISGLASLLVTFILARWKFKIEFDMQIIKYMLNFGFPLYLNYLLTFIFQKADTLIIGALLGSAEIALYEIAKKIPESLEMFYTGFRQVYFPFFSKLREIDPKKATDLLNHSIRIFAFLGFSGSLGSILFGKEIIVTLFSDKYLASVPVFVLMMVVLTANFISYTHGYSLIAIGDTKRPALINIFHTIINLSSNLLLIPRLRLIGAALSSIVGVVAVNPLYIYFLRRKNVQAEFWVYVKPLLLFIGFAIPSALIPPQNYIIKVLILLLYVLVCLIMNVFSYSDVVLLFTESKNFILQFIVRFRSKAAATK